MATLSLSFVSAALLALVQDSVGGIDCSKWQNSGNPMSAIMSLARFSAAAMRQLNCYRTIAGLPDLKHAMNFNDADEEALREKGEAATKDVINGLNHEHLEDKLKEKKPEQTGASVTQAQNTNAKDSKSTARDAARKKVNNGATSVVVNSAILERNA